MSKKSEVCKWIIGLSGSEWDDVTTKIVVGTVSEVKKYLARLCKEDQKECEDFDYGDTRICDVKEVKKGRKYYAGSTFKDHHCDYTATLIDSEPERLSDILKKDPLLFI